MCGGISQNPQLSETDRTLSPMLVGAAGQGYPAEVHSQLMTQLGALCDKYEGDLCRKKAYIHVSFPKFS